MKRRFKTCLYSLFGLIPIALLTCFSISWRHSTSISCVGSSGVKPFLEQLSYQYLLIYPQYDITVDAGGSGFGISQVAEGFSDIGNASKDPYEAVKEQYQTQWKEKNIKTITVGWEGICLLFIPPVGMSDEGLSKLRTCLTLNQTNAIQLYRLFSGYSDNLGDKYRNLGGFLSNNSGLNQNDINLLNNQPISPFVRSGGSTTSGTAASFFAGSHFTIDSNELTDRQKKAFKTGDYGSDTKVYDTDEANSRAWDYFFKNKKPGGMIYLSSGFVEQNKDLIEKEHIGILAYNDHPFSVKKIKDANDGYNFYRPLNVMLAVDESSAKWKFIQWLIGPDSSEEQWEKTGAKKITNTDKESMSSKDGKFAVSDCDLFEGNPWPKNWHFGAKDK